MKPPPDQLKSRRRAQGPLVKIWKSESEMKRPTRSNQVASIRIGTSGWTYDGWRGPFYPDDIPKKDWLKHYATQFMTTEINGSFYRTPSLDAVRNWRSDVPEDFTFAWKASKFITHWKRLTEKCMNSIALMETRLKVLEPKVVAVLFQLPPQFSKDSERLNAFLAMLPRCHPYSFEFRHKSWYSDDIFDVLHNHGASLCLSDHSDAPSPWEVTAMHVYVRGHGPSGRYHGSYPAKTLKRWADAVAKWTLERRDVLIYFDNDQKAAAPKDARRLQQIIKSNN